MSQFEAEKTPQQEPLFNIGAVSRMTEIPEATLRVWERRYSFPNATRTGGGHRLYSQHEIRRIQWVKRQIDAGVQASLAIQALHRTEQESSQPFFAQEPGLHSLEKSTSAEITLAGYHQRLFEALTAHDTAQTDTLLTESLGFFPLENILLDVISPTLADIGEAWSEGRINVATEHFASNALRNHLLAWLRSSPPAYPVSPVVLACAPGELHEGSLLILAVLLRRLRWNVIYLGQSMPLADLATFMDEVKPSVLVFVAMMEPPARALTEWFHWLPKVAESGTPIVAFGGRAFNEYPHLAELVPGILLGSTLREGVAMLDRLLHKLNPLL
ncbi:MAG: MerR family transcriptional regulator [Anaerolineae bacterium]|nr:MerR family transcriptional regulator [Anaerolineae bacterium]